LGRLAKLILGLLLVVGAGAGGTAVAKEADDGEAIRGTLRADGDPVQGVTIVAFDAGGDEIGRAESDSDGEWRIPLPGPGQYAATLDEGSLPDDIRLRFGAGDRITFHSCVDAPRNWRPSVQPSRLRQTSETGTIVL
jgi:hypothetical protein